jgi:hypothetical protein
LRSCVTDLVHVKAVYVSAAGGGRRARTRE